MTEAKGNDKGESDERESGKMVEQVMKEMMEQVVKEMEKAKVIKEVTTSQSQARPK
eukprot:TRINITY_DN1790_c0_g1_i1.p1 TRINITY_DN1790_c0_g1~~TRINITY_DN1790_c0_g1_i1.p1  ORF type:complete len:56 (+),score=17.88 TRINITY_DN1790_c0_g1_i1:124-291(+)